MQNKWLKDRMSDQDEEKKMAAAAAVALVKDGDVVGLGTGSTATFAIQALAKKVHDGLKIVGVGSSVQTEKLARALGIPIWPLGEIAHIDISIDGADEFTADLNLIKGGGGALFREKIVASLSRYQVIVTDASKQVQKLGAFKVPVEVIPVAYAYVLKQLEQLHGKPVLRQKEDGPWISDNQNFIVDVDFGLIDEPEKLALALNQIDGLLAHGLFIGLTSRIIMASDGKLFSFPQA